MKYGKEMTQEIASFISSGLMRTDACTMAGISYETFTQWMKKPEFSDAIKVAEVKFKHRNLEIIQKAANRTWQAAAWLMERKFQNEFSIKQTLEVNDNRGERPSTDALLRTIAETRKELDDLRSRTSVESGK